MEYVKFLKWLASVLIYAGRQIHQLWPETAPRERSKK